MLLQRFDCLLFSYLSLLCFNRTFQPLWLVLKTSTEKLSTVHMQTLQRLNQLMKEINKYCDDHHRKQKQIKNEELSTIEAINELKEIFIALNKV